MAPQLRSRRRFLSSDSNMSRATKAGRKSCKPEENGCEDRLSDLPDAIICHILSFLDTKYAVATSLLSKRWKHLFIYVPNIILDNSLTRKTTSVGVDQEFALFGLRQVMLRKVPYISQFRLKCNFSLDDPVIETLVRTVVWRHVKEIDISIGEVDPLGSLPCELFTSTSLVVLKLKGKWTEDEPYLVVPELVCLPSLKVLQLDGFFFESGLNRLFQGCELLEVLFLCRCDFWRVEVLDISLPFLRKLSFNHGDNWVGEYTSLAYIRLVLDTPNLEFFEYRGHIGSLEVKKPMPHARAEFELPEWEDTEDSDDAKNAFPSINNLRGIKSLYLSKDSLELMYPLGAIPSASEVTVFENLTLLELGFYDLRMLPCILACAPELETLIIREHDYVDYEDFKAIYPPPETVPVCLANNLSNIVFRDFVSSKDEFELMKYLLENGKVLRSMKISGIDRGCKASNRKSIRKKLEMLSRFSETCKIVLDY